MAEYLVTGGCGFVGSHLAEALIAGGDRVVVLDNLSSGKRENLPPGARLVEGDVADPEAVAQAIRGCAGVYHLAGAASVAWCNENWHAGHLTNQTGTVILLETAARAGRLPVVYISSAAIYGDAGEGRVDEGRAARPLTAYGADKYGSELHGRIAWSVHGVPTVGLRPFNIYGPRQDPASAYSGVISIFHDRLARGLPVTIFGDGQQTRDFVFVEDVIRFLLAAMERAPGLAGQVFNVCTGRPTTLLDLVGTLARLHGRTPEILHAAPRLGDIRHSLGDPARAEAALGVSAGMRLDEGLSRLRDGR
ncbi:NAD-dependent epimerase/dehydratase family protein [Tabrizicola soli]|uniref:NAD-dependent epimerase/dehydratase family protein n=1 Tax=Tabrizicola soli TaxID=2185115 RepID=A0ABV7DT79_9RHOB|nr:NAD-dependent epimerase/dehydratase family protein [Tabrizicola soli]